MAIDIGDAALELLSATRPSDAMSRLVELSALAASADRCTLTSIDEGVLRVEASYDRQRIPEFVDHEYPLTAVAAQPLLGEAIATGAIVIGEGFRYRPEVHAELSAALDDIRSTAVVPLCRERTVVALLILSRRSLQPFVAEDLEDIQRLGGVGVLALGNIRLLGGVNVMQRRGLEALTTMSAHVASSDRPPAFFAKMSQSVAALAGAAGAAFWLINDGHLALQPDPFGFPMTDMLRVRIPLDALKEIGFDGVVDRGEALYVRAPIAEAARLVTYEGVKDVLVVPWKTAGSQIGFLMAYDSTSGFVEQDEWIMRLAARASALVWQGYRAEQRANELQVTEVNRLQEHAARVEDLDRRKSDFLSLTSHELRGPISVLRGYLAMLQDETLAELPEDVHQILATMQDRVDHMRDLVNHTLDVARVEESRQLVSPDDLDITVVVQGIVDSIDARLRGKRSIMVRSDGHLSAYADRAQVATIIGNLLSNALKYSADGSDVLTVVRQDGPQVAVDVIDHGVGIAEGDLTRLFQPFERLESPGGPHVDGIGLGLYLCRELARLQGGGISVQSVVGQGSVFTLRLPLRPRALS